MATKKELTEAQLRKARADDAVIYKVMLALVLLCAGLMGLRSLRAFYDTVGGFDALYDATPWIALGAFAASLALGAAVVFLKNKYVRAVCPWLLTGTLLTSVTALVMHYSWTNDFPLLYILFSGVLIQYIVMLLYRWEFFLVSLNTVTAGGIFYRLSRGGGIDSLEMILLACLALLLLATTACAFLAAKNKGKLVLGSRLLAALLSEIQSRGPLHGQRPVAGVHDRRPASGQPVQLLLHVCGHRRGADRGSVLHLPTQLKGKRKPVLSKMTGPVLFC